MGRKPERKQELVAFIEKADIECLIKQQQTNLLTRISSLTGIQYDSLPCPKFWLLFIHQLV